MWRWITAAVLVWGWTAREAGARPKGYHDEVTVRVYVRSDFVPEISCVAMMRAEEEATRLFAEAGIRLEWRSGTPKTGDTGPDVVGLSLQASAPAAYRTPGRAYALAAAMPYAADNSKILLFGDRLARYTEALHGVRRGKVLGHVMAHEIGHVLEAEARHSESGLMKAFWTREDFAAMQHGELGFAPVDRELLRKRTSEGLRPRQANRTSSGPSVKARTPTEN